MKILVTGGAGFIGSALIRHLIAETEHHVVNVDALTYAANLDALENASDSSRYAFEHIDIRDSEAVRLALINHQPDGIIHLAAESHVDRSIDGPDDFIQTNIVGTFNLLDTARAYYEGLDSTRKTRFRFHHVSTDEVYGSIGKNMYFVENSNYAPNSPYSATKAASDHLVRAWYKTYGLPVVVTHSSNNYGPHQFPDKLIPLLIDNALAGKPLQIYGDGHHERDWIFVKDHVVGLRLVFERAGPGERYNIGNGQPTTNLEIAKYVCRLVDEISPDKTIGPREHLIRLVKDRPGHDRRYAINSAKIRSELGWGHEYTLEQGLRKTIAWHIESRWPA